MAKTAVLTEVVQQLVASLAEENYEEATSYLSKLDSELKTIDFSRALDDTLVAELQRINVLLSENSVELAVISDEIMQSLRHVNNASALTDGPVYRKHHGKL